MIRTEGDVVRASDQACELSGLVARFLIEFRKYSNGVNGVNVPDGYFTVVLKKPELVDDQHVFVCCTLIHQRTESYEVPKYFDPDSDNYTEGWGANNISHYETETHTSIESKGYRIPWRQLILSNDDLVAYLKSLKQRAKEREAEEQRQREIESLRKRLIALESTTAKDQTP